MSEISVINDNISLNPIREKSFDFLCIQIKFVALYCLSTWLQHHNDKM